MNNLKISLVIPTYNRKSSLQRVIGALQKQTVPLDEFEVIVVSDGAADGTNEYLGDLQNRSGRAGELQLRPIFQPNQGVAVARNNGFRAAQADLILFLDDDVIPAPGLVRAHLDYQPRDVIVLGPMLTPLDTRLAPWVMWEQRMLEKQYRAMLAGKWEPTARQFYTGNTSLYKKYLQQAGGFDPAFRRAEDVELAYRLKDLGCRFVFNLKAEAYHYADRSFTSWNNSAYAYGRNDVIMARSKGQAWLLPTIFREFRGRSWLIRQLTSLCLGRPVLLNFFCFLLGRVAAFASVFGLEKVSRPAYSGIFNVRYYQGAADELGGRDLFWAAMQEYAHDNRAIAP